MGYHDTANGRDRDRDRIQINRRDPSSVRDRSEQQSVRYIDNADGAENSWNLCGRQVVRLAVDWYIDVGHEQSSESKKVAHDQAEKLKVLEQKLDVDDVFDDLDWNLIEALPEGLVLELLLQRRHIQGLIEVANADHGARKSGHVQLFIGGWRRHKHWLLLVQVAIRLEHFDRRLWLHLLGNTAPTTFNHWLAEKGNWEIGNWKLIE